VGIMVAWLRRMKLYLGQHGMKILGIAGFHDEWQLSLQGMFGDRVVMRYFCMHTIRLMMLTCLMLLAAVSAVAGQSGVAQGLSDDRSRVAAAAYVLAESYDSGTGLFRGTGWWNSANGISALVNASRELGTKEFDSILENTFVAAQRKNANFLNEYYDDEGWWALAWLDVYELRGGAQYLAMSQSIFGDMTGGWADVCGGGIWWKKKEKYKNSIANELFLSVAVRLAAATSGKDRARYLDWAKREKRWFVQSGLINEQGLINDGLDGACRNNHKTTWTYNQGVILTGLSGLSRLTHDTSSMRLANRIAHAVHTQLEDARGILHDPCEPECGEDGIQFKGILVRNLAVLDRAAPSAEIAEMLKQNAASIWENARTEKGMFSVNWAGPARDSGTGSLISALDALTAPLSGTMR
jgi:predicted alpha-1,6-mannanase (GH76 family)